MRQKIILDPEDLKALREGQDLLISIGGMTVPMSYSGARASRNGHEPEAENHPAADAAGRRQWSVEAKEAAVRRVLMGERQAALVKELGITYGLMSSWMKRHRPGTSPKKKNGQAKVDVSLDDRRRIARRYAAGEATGTLAREVGVSTSTILTWARTLAPESKKARRPGRFASREDIPPEKRRAIVKRLAGGETAVALAKEVGVTSTTIRRWKDDFATKKK